ncbi:MAG TPA: type IV pilus secretin PilQ [Nitrospiraceae bacterium]|nr:type IV pilus secretin PilQ [Nitrospiraceae bacterium]
MRLRRIVSIAALALVFSQAPADGIHWAAPALALAAEPASLERVRVADLGDRLRIEVEGDRPLSYSMSAASAPPRVTVDIPDVTKGADVRRMDIHQSPVLDMTPNEIDQPRPGLQLVFGLSQAVRPDIHADGTRLFIDFPKNGTTGPPPGVDEAASHVERLKEPAGAAAEEVHPSPARTLSKIDVQKDDTEAQVFLEGDGVLSCQAKRLDANRVIIDLPNVTASIRSKVINVNHALIRVIRIGHHARKIRLVLEVAKETAYSLSNEHNRVAIRLTRSSGGAAAGPPESELQADMKEPAAADASLVQTASAAKVPFPQRLAMINARPMAQMPPKAKEDSEEIGQRRYVGRRISLDFQAADISNVLRLIAEVSGFNIVVGEGVKSKVTMKLVGVPWDQALDMILKMNNLGMIREGNIVWIDSLTNISRQQEEEAKAKDSKTKAEDLITRVVYVQNVTAQEIQTTLRQYVSPRGQLTVNAASNALILQDTESRIGGLTELIRSLDLEVPQVQIEARIVQADTSFSRSLGVQWGIANTASALNGQGTTFFGNPTGGFSEQQTDTKGTVTRSFLVNLPAAVTGLTSVPAAGFTFGKIGTRDGFTLDLRLSAGELLGLTKVIAAPKITTLDKREAKISQGESIPFQTTSLQGTQTTFVDANLELQVTPQITSRDPKEIGKQVLLKIKATRNAVGARSNPAGPSIDKREATTQVMVRDGETMVIGGVFVDSQTNTVGGVPYLSRIPVLGWLFKNKTETVAKQELLIFLTPTIVKQT